MPRQSAKPAVSLPYKLSDVGAPDSLRAHLLRHLEALAVHHYSDRTIASVRESVGYFIRWAEERELYTPHEITLPIIERYQRHLYYLRKPNGKPLSSQAQHQRLCLLRSYFRWLVKQRYLLFNPAAELDLPKIEQRLPKAILNASEIEQVMMQPDLSTAPGLRDRAILEVLYSTGIRRSEVTNLKVHDIDVERGTLTVRLGKGKKDRVVPIGERALQWIEKYQRDVRPQLLVDPLNDVLFLNYVGNAIRPESLSQQVRDYVIAAGLGKIGSCHLFRHTMATLMLENGADVRYIQAILGHSNLATTQIYTHVAIRQLKAIHDATHPASQARKATKNDHHDDTPTADDLISALSAEREDENAALQEE